LFDRITQDERLFATDYCATSQDKPLASRWLPRKPGCDQLEREAASEDRLLANSHGPLHAPVRPVTRKSSADGWLLFVHDMSFVTSHSEETKRYLFLFFIALTAVSLVDDRGHRASITAWLDVRHARTAAGQYRNTLAADRRQRAGA